MLSDDLIAKGRGEGVRALDDNTLPPKFVSERKKFRDEDRPPEDIVGTAANGVVSNGGQEVRWLRTARGARARRDGRLPFVLATALVGHAFGRRDRLGVPSKHTLSPKE